MDALLNRRFFEISRRQFADVLLFAVTSAELVLLFYLTPTLTLTDWIYVVQHLIVLGVAVTRDAPKARDYSLGVSVAVGIAYIYPYAQAIYLRFLSGYVTWEAGGLVIVTIGAGLSLVGLVTMGRTFGVRPALRGLVTTGPFRLVRHPIYLSYLLADIGYNLQESNIGTLLIVFVGWAALICRIKAEEHVISEHEHWRTYCAAVPYRLLPGLW